MCCVRVYVLCVRVVRECGRVCGAGVCVSATSSGECVCVSTTCTCSLMSDAPVCVCVRVFVFVFCVYVCDDQLRGGILFWREMLMAFDMFVDCFCLVTFCFAFCSKCSHKRNCVKYLHHVQ